MIYVDYREPEKIIELLKKNNAVKVAKLEVGDYIIDGVVIERKTIVDFLSSLASGKIFEQVERLRQNCQKPYLLIEGLIDWSYMKNPHWFCSSLQKIVLS